MKKTQAKEFDKKKSPHSKGFTEGINALYDEIQLAFQWRRPSILLAIHTTPGGQLIAQQFLEKKLLKTNQKVKRITPENDNPDVINTVYSTPNHEKTVFFISGLERANQLSPEGNVYRALNIHREHLVEQKICAVFWLTEIEAANLPRLAPDFWAFRHRVIEFAPKRGPRNPSTPSGLFLWKDQLPWMDLDAQKKQTAYYEDLLSHLPDDENATTTRLDTTLKLVQLHWQLNNHEHFSRHLKNILAILNAHANLQYHGWTLNVKGIKLFEDGDKQGARTCFEQALAIEPDNSLFIVNSGVAAHGVGKNREAILAVKRALKINPDNIYLWHVLGLLYLFVGKPQNAVETLEMAAEKEPHDLNVQFTLAIGYSKNNQTEACAALLEKLGKRTAEQNILQSACQSALSGNMEGGLDDLRQALEAKQINQHQLVQDPNIRALFDLQSLMTISE